MSPSLNTGRGTRGDGTGQAPAALPTAVVLSAPGYLPADPRRLLITPDAGTSPAPAYLQGGLQLILGAGARVYFERIGRRLVVTGAV